MYQDWDKIKTYKFRFHQIKKSERLARFEPESGFRQTVIINLSADQT